MDINDIKARMNNLNSYGAKKPRDLFKAKTEHDVRCVPQGDVDGEQFKELFFHYEVTQGGILCPKMNFDEDCDICDLAEMLKSWKDADGNDKPEINRKQDFELFKKIQAKASIFTTIIERGKEAEGAKWWRVTPTQVNDICAICSDGDRLSDIGLAKDDTKHAIKVVFGIDKAYDLHLKMLPKGTEENKKSFDMVKITGRIKSTPLAASPAEAKKIIDSIKPLSEVYPKISSDEVSKLLKKFIGNSMGEAKTGGGGEYGKKPADTHSKEDSKMSGSRPLEEALGDMCKDDKK